MQVDRAAPGARRAAAFHRLPSGLEDDRDRADAARHAHPRAGDRPACGPALRLHRQRARRRRRQHLLPGLRERSDRARLVRDPQLPPHRRRRLHALRHAARRPLPEIHQALRRQAHPGPPFSTRERIIALMARLPFFLVVLLLSFEALAQTYPARPVRMIVGFPPGGGTDILARIVAQKLSEAWGQQVVVENRPGASATIAANAVAKAAPDGYTLSMGQLTPNAIAPALVPKPPYDALRDFAPIVLVGTSPNVLVIHPGLPAR